MIISIKGKRYPIGNIFYLCLGLLAPAHHALAEPLAKPPTAASVWDEAFSEERAEGESGRESYAIGSAEMVLGAGGAIALQSRVDHSLARTLAEARERMAQNIVADRFPQMTRWREELAHTRTQLAFLRGLRGEEVETLRSHMQGLETKEGVLVRNIAGLDREYAAALTAERIRLRDPQRWTNAERAAFREVRYGRVLAHAGSITGALAAVKGFFRVGAALGGRNPGFMPGVNMGIHLPKHLARETLSPPPRPLPPGIRAAEVLANGG